MLTADGLQRICLEQPAAEETFPFSAGLSVFKVGGRIFALAELGADPLSVSLKCVPETAVAFRLDYPAITPGYHLNKRHWNTVLLDGSVPDRLVQEMIEDSYDLVRAKLPKAVRIALGDVGSGASG